MYELRGSYPARERPRKLLQFPPQFGPTEPTRESLERDLRALARTPWVEGVMFRADGLSLDLSTAYALRKLLGILRDADKTSRVYLGNLDTASYYFASGADEVVMPESGELFVLGVGLEQFYLRDLLDRLGVGVDVLAVRDYKTAFEPLARREMSEAQREQYGRFLESVSATFRQGVARRREVTADEVQGWLEHPPISATQARDLGMIDTVAYEDELIGTDDKPFASVARLLLAPRRAPSKRVAVVSLEGVIVTGSSRRSPLPVPLVGEQAGSDTLVRALRQAAQDPQTGAIVLYVDSGGGSALASDLIGREVMRARQHKPVVAVMGSVAASGGYYVLTHANVVMAAPTTLTGSIGVVVGKPVLEEAFGRYGVSSERLEPYPFALAFSASYPFDDKQRDWLERYTDDVYQRFVARVAAGRGLSRDDVDALGRGRIWSGTDALERGLIDELGDLPAAIARAKQLADLPGSAPVYNVRAPSKLILPTRDDPSTLLRSLAPLQRERTLLLCPSLYSVR
ncbi:MAG: S49 family peptidase [Trueperaceae bacterium]|nr:S49 family peptidase [Trueperaceae bacterium]